MMLCPTVPACLASTPSCMLQVPGNRTNDRSSSSASAKSGRWCGCRCVVATLMRREVGEVGKGAAIIQGGKAGVRDGESGL